jgi:hypothetical protein
MPGTLPQRGNILYGFTIGPTYTPAQVAGATTAEQTFTQVGMKAGDAVSVSTALAQTAGIFIAYARCVVNDQLIICFGNVTAGALTPISGQYVLSIERPENTALAPNSL